ncbi:MAG TPA: hypothetical protein VIX59_17705 [Candidatus Binataceae bacterium]
MSWPLKLRAASFVITIGVVLGEFAMVAVPVAILICLIGIASASRIVDVTIALAVATALAIATYGHVGPQRTQRTALQGRGRP